MRLRLFASAALGIMVLSAPLRADAVDGNTTTGGSRTTTGGEVFVGRPGSGGRQTTRIVLVADGANGGSSFASQPMVCFDYTVSGGQDQSGTSMGRGEQITDLSAIRQGDLVWVECLDPATDALLGATIVVWDLANPNPSLPPTAAAIGQAALSRLVLPVPAIRSWPPTDRNLVGLETWLRVDSFAGDERTASLGSVSATVVARPVRAVWHLGETDLTCTSAGTIWTESAEATDCGYTFVQHTGSVKDASVDVVYHLTWTSSLGDAGDLGEVTRTTTFPLRVWEAQALIE